MSSTFVISRTNRVGNVGGEMGKSIKKFRLSLEMDNNSVWAVFWIMLFVAMIYGAC